jgi:hypothetical protein
MLMPEVLHWPIAECKNGHVHGREKAATHRCTVILAIMK